MFASRTQRRTIICAIACALLSSISAGVAAASANERTQTGAALAQERYYSSYGDPDTIDAGTAAAQPPQELRIADNRTDEAALAWKRYYSALADRLRDARAIEIALAQERYYSSYGEAEPLTAAQSPAPSDDTPWLPIALSVAAALAIVAASATLARRLRIRRHRVTT